MPKIARAQYTPTDDRWWGDVEKLGDDERKKRQDVIDEAWRYYKGDMPLPLRLKPDDPNYNILLDLCGQAVDAMVAFLGVPTLDVKNGTAGEPNDAGVVENTKSPEQQMLEAILEALDLDVLMVDLMLSGFISGHTFLKLIELERDPFTGELVSLPSAALLDPRYVTVYWVVPGQALFYRLKWTVDDDETRIQDIVPNHLLNERIAGDGQALTARQQPGWTIIEYAARRGGRVEEIGRDDWAYPFAPILDWKNSPNTFEYYGRPDLTPIRLRTNDSANLSASNTQKILVHHAGPQTVVTGGALPDEIDSGPATIIELSEADAKVYNLEMTSDLSSSLNFLTMTRSAFFESAKVVDRASIKDKLGDLTNFAVRMLYGAQSDAALQKQLYYGRGTVRMAQGLMALVGADVKVGSSWDDLLPQDRGEQVASVATEQGMGIVSEQTLLEELGHDPEVEKQRKAAELDNQQDSIANALVRLGRQGLMQPGAGNRQLGAGQRGQ